MARRQPSSWSQPLADCLTLAEAITRKVSRNLPIDLGAVAAHCGVQRIEFRQLLVLGGVSIVRGGFAVYIGCDPGMGETLTDVFASDGTGRNLPDRIRSRARFTIAHEIAHTMLFDIRDGTPVEKFKLKRAASIGSLERVCNTVAAALLLPEWLMLRDGDPGCFIEPTRLRKLADEALVSPETLIRRFQRIRREDHPDGIIAAVSKISGTNLLQAISRHYRLRQLFTDAIVGAPLQTLIDDPDLCAFGGDFSHLEHFVRYTGGASHPYTFRCENRASRKTTNFFLTVCERIP